MRHGEIKDRASMATSRTRGKMAMRPSHAFDRRSVGVKYRSWAQILWEPHAKACGVGRRREAGGWLRLKGSYYILQVSSFGI